MKQKIEFVGSSIVRKEDYYHVWGVLVAVKKVKKLDTSRFEVDVINDWEMRNEYICSCTDCSISRIPNGEEPRCRFVRELKKYLGDKN